jgi:hypothetical protein
MPKRRERAREQIEAAAPASSSGRNARLGEEMQDRKQRRGDERGGPGAGFALDRRVHRAARTRLLEQRDRDAGAHPTRRCARGSESRRELRVHATRSPAQQNAAPSAAVRCRCPPRSGTGRKRRHAGRSRNRAWCARSNAGTATRAAPRPRASRAGCRRDETARRARPRRELVERDRRCRADRGGEQQAGREPGEARTATCAYFADRAAGSGRKGACRGDRRVDVAGVCAADKKPRLECRRREINAFASIA